MSVNKSMIRDFILLVFLKTKIKFGYIKEKCE